MQFLPLRQYYSFRAAVIELRIDGVGEHMPSRLLFYLIHHSLVGEESSQN